MWMMREEDEEEEEGGGFVHVFTWMSRSRPPLLSYKRSLGVGV